MLVAKEIDEKQDHPVFKNELPSNMWFTRFLDRHKLSLRSTMSKSLARLEMELPAIRDEFFEAYAKIRNDYNISGKDIYNEDETGIQFVCKSPKTVAKKGEKYVYARKSGERSVNISIAMCSNALGSVIIPPFLIFKGLSFLSDLHTECFPENTIFANSKSGYMVTDIFAEWLRIFVENIPPKRPVLLLLDGHVSHVSLNAIEFAKDNGVLMLCFPPHTTHLLQPMDNGPNITLKNAFKDESNKRMRKMKRRLKNEDFGKVFKQAWERTCSQMTMKSGFVKTGLWPVNPAKMLIRERDNEASSQPDSSLDVQSCSTTSDTTLDVQSCSITSDTTFDVQFCSTPSSSSAREQAKKSKGEQAVVDAITALLQPSPQKEQITTHSRRIHVSR